MIAMVVDEDADADGELDHGEVVPELEVVAQTTMNMVEIATTNGTLETTIFTAIGSLPPVPDEQ